jgi:hypothetical protein
MSYLILKLGVRQTASIIFVLQLLLLPAAMPICSAQIISPRPASDSSQTQIQQPYFRLERIPLAGGAELLTIFGSLDGLTNDNLKRPAAIRLDAHLHTPLSRPTRRLRRAFSLQSCRQ